MNPFSDTPDPFDPSELNRLNDFEHRRAVKIPGYRTEQTDLVTRCFSDSGQAYIFWQRSLQDMLPLIRAEVDWHRARARRLTWKVYGHDAPATLHGDLLALGFELEGPPNHGAAIRVDQLPPMAPDRPGYAIKRLQRSSELEELIELYGHIWPDEDNALWLSGYRGALDAGEDGLGLFLACSALGPAVASGGVIHHRGQAVGHLFGGGTRPDHRRLGLYQALVAHRGQWLASRGGRWLVVDAGQESWPILSALGFKAFTAVSFYSLDLRRLA